MSDAAAKLMTVDEFLVWGEGREGRWELRDGVVVAMSPERLGHLRAKGAAFSALSTAIRRASAPCEAFPDGAIVRISRRTAFEPDALVRCGPPLPPATLEFPDPIIVVEVLSPSTEAYDRGAKLEGYFSLASVMHYLIIDADRQKIVHHKRGAGDMIETRIFASGPLKLDPPGLELTVESLFAPG
jgi:Uma2 family endonuclease